MKLYFYTRNIIKDSDATIIQTVINAEIKRRCDKNLIVIVK